MNAYIKLRFSLTILLLLTLLSFSYAKILPTKVEIKDNYVSAYYTVTLSNLTKETLYLQPILTNKCSTLSINGGDGVSIPPSSVVNGTLLWRYYVSKSYRTPAQEVAFAINSSRPKNINILCFNPRNNSITFYHSLDSEVGRYLLGVKSSESSLNFSIKYKDAKFSEYTFSPFKNTQ